MSLIPGISRSKSKHRAADKVAERDTSRFEDQATEPIKVTTLREALGIGPVLATQGSTDPAHLPAA
ncbi:hypothetical protein ACIA71_02010 [Streptomyces anulatus]